MGKSRQTPGKNVYEAKFHKVMKEYKHHTLHSGSKHGRVVASRDQALAIASSEARRTVRRAKR